jgi:excinuclease ABC subunit C
VVASLVVFEDGLPKRSDYRRFAIREHPGDDVASIAEVVRRRFTHGNARPGDANSTTSDADRSGEVAGDPVDAEPTYRRGIDPETGRPRRFAYPPQLLVVDGGAPQVNAAATELAELGIVDVTICGLAKRLEEVWVPGQDEPIIFPRTSEALYLLQRLRDEAHRFAITYHRAKRSKSMTVSALDNVAGLGDVRRKALIRHFGSVSALRKADVEQVLAVPGLGRRTAEAVVAALAGSAVVPQSQAPASVQVAATAVGRALPSPTATEANPIPSTGTQQNAAPVNGIGDG